MTTERLDATTAPTAPFTPTPQHAWLTELAGRWIGETQTWFDPESAPETSPTGATIEALLGGRWIRIDYQGTAMERPHAGVLLLGFHRDPQLFEAAWIDSFHTGTAIMMSVGAPRSDGLVSVLGSYAAGSERWGWRTTLRRDADELVLESFNVTPTGQELRAVLTRLRRA
jgi:hypothetical protein